MNELVEYMHEQARSLKPDPRQLETVIKDDNFELNPYYQVGVFHGLLVASKLVERMPNAQSVLEEFLNQLKEDF